jgi:hypothetical protein
MEAVYRNGHTQTVTDEGINAFIGKWPRNLADWKGGRAAKDDKETPARTRERKIQKEVNKTLEKIRKSSAEQQNQLIGAIPVDFNNCILEDFNYSTPQESQPLITSDERVIIQGRDNSITKSGALANWAVYHKIRHTALNDLLKIIRTWMTVESFPKDSRTLLKTPRRVKVVDIVGGQLYHLGILSCIRQGLLSGTEAVFLPKLTCLDAVDNLITITVGIDGLPISKSSNLQFWPMLCYIDQAMDSSVYLISLFYGNSKPSSIHEFLVPFIEEMKELERHGFLFNKNFLTCE